MDEENSLALVAYLRTAEIDKRSDIEEKVTTNYEKIRMYEWTKK